MSWVQGYGEGRVFYCSLGHRNEIFWNPQILQHYLDGIQFAFGDLEADTAPVPLDPTKIEPNMGEYVGIYEDGEGGAVMAEAKVLAVGGGGYRAILTAPRRLPGGKLAEYVPAPAWERAERRSSVTSFARCTREPKRSWSNCAN